VRELQELRRQASSSIVVPQGPWGAAARSSCPDRVSVEQTGLAGEPPHARVPSRISASSFSGGEYSMSIPSGFNFAPMAGDLMARSSAGTSVRGLRPARLPARKIPTQTPKSCSE